MLPTFLGRADSALVEVPGAAQPVLREIWSVIHPDVRRSARVRLMADLIADVVQASAAILI